MWEHGNKSERATHTEQHASPLPYCLAIAGALAPLLILRSTDSVAPQQHNLQAWGVSTAALSGLVAACAGVLIRGSRRWSAFLAAGLVLGTAFGTFVAGATFPGGPDTLPLIIPVAVICAMALTLVAATIFGAHRRLLQSRVRSLVGEVDRFSLWSVTGATVVVVAWLVDLAAPPSATRFVIASAGFIGVAAAVIARQRHLRHLLQVTRSAEQRIEDPPDGEAIHDLGLGEEHWATGRGSAPYRTPGLPLNVIRGSVRAASRRAWQAIVGDAIVLPAALCAVLHIGWSSLQSRAEHEAIKTAQKEIATEPVAAPIRTGSWYPGQVPTLVDINNDDVEDIIGLRWDSSQSQRALFVTAHDGASLRALWATEPLPSQWMSGRTHLVHSGSVLFLTDSEHSLHIYDVASGRQLHQRDNISAAHSLCVPAGDPPRLWLTDPESWRDRRAGSIIDAGGKITAASRPKDCTPADRHTLGGALGEWDATCSKKLASRMPPQTAYFKKAGVGVAISSRGDQPLAAGYNPDGCGLRWNAPLAFTGEPLHRSPRLSNRLGSGRLYSLYQLDSGHWHVGARDATAGGLLWQRTLPRAERGTNVEKLYVSPQRVYVTRDWRLDVLRAADGNPLGQI